MIRFLQSILISFVLVMQAVSGESVTAGDGFMEQAPLVEHESNRWRALPSEADTAINVRLDGVDHLNQPAHSVHWNYNLPGAGQPPVPHPVGIILDLGGLDGSDFDHLVFWIRGDAASGFEPQLELQFRRPEPGKPGAQQIGSFTIGAIGPDWQRFSIPLADLAGIQDWHDLQSLALALPKTLSQGPTGGYLIDEIAMVKTGNAAETQSVKATVASGGENPPQSSLKSRLTGWPAVAQVDPKSLPAQDPEFLLRLATDTWRGIDALTDKAHGLPLDRVEFQPGSIAPETARIGDYTNITNVGMYFLAVTAAVDLKLISHAQALERLNTTLNTLDGLATHDGFFYNYYNTTTLQPGSHFISFVDSSWLTSGLMVARQAFPEIQARLTQLIDRGHYQFFYDGGQQLMAHGYDVDAATRSTYHYGIFFAESRLGSLIAIGRQEVPEEHWFRMSRTLPPEITWQTGKPLGLVPRSAGRFSWTAGHYHWRDYDYVPSWGGSLFEALMPMLVLDELQYAPKSLGQNGIVHTTIHRRYAIEELGYSVWGMSPSSTPGSNSYAEYGVRELGVAGYKSGVVTPHAAALAIMTEPKEAIRNLRRLASDFAVYGDFGFYDAVNPVNKQVAHDYLCLNQSMILVALANHLADHSIQKRFAADPVIQRALPLLKIEQFFE